MEGIINALIRARKARNLTQTELGKRLGLPQSYISKLESGKIDARISSITEIARYLNLEMILIPSNLVPTIFALTGTDESYSTDTPIYTLDDLDTET